MVQKKLLAFIKEFNIKGGQYVYRDQLARRLYRKEKMLDVDLGGSNTASRKPFSLHFSCSCIFGSLATPSP